MSNKFNFEDIYQNLDDIYTNGDNLIKNAIQHTIHHVQPRIIGFFKNPPKELLSDSSILGLSDLFDLVDLEQYPDILKKYLFYFPQNIKYVKNQTFELCKIAYEKNSFSYFYFNDEMKKQFDEPVGIKLPINVYYPNHANLSYNLVSYIALKDKTEEAGIALLQNNPNYLKYIKNQTVCHHEEFMNVVKNKNTNVTLGFEDIQNPTDDIAKFIISRAPYSYIRCDHVNVEYVKLAIDNLSNSYPIKLDHEHLEKYPYEVSDYYLRKYPHMLESIPEKYRSQELRNMYILSKNNSDIFTNPNFTLEEKLAAARNGTKVSKYNAHLINEQIYIESISYNPHYIREYENYIIFNEHGGKNKAQLDFIKKLCDIAVRKDKNLYIRIKNMHKTSDMNKMIATEKPEYLAYCPKPFSKVIIKSAIDSKLRDEIPTTVIKDLYRYSDDSLKVLVKLAFGNRVSF